MNILSITDARFSQYGCVIRNFDFALMLDVLENNTPKPENSVVYVPSEKQLESLAIFDQVKANLFGGLPIQAGYCNGSSIKLNCLEYHKSSEVIIAAEDIILLLARQQDIKHGMLDTSKVEGFLMPARSAVELYSTSLHYAPCNANGNKGFRTVIILPKGTNTAKPSIDPINPEDSWLAACNKWLLAHPDSPEAKNGAYVGLKGENVEV